MVNADDGCKREKRGRKEREKKRHEMKAEWPLIRSLELLFLTAAGYRPQPRLPYKSL